MADAIATRRPLVPSRRREAEQSLIGNLENAASRLWGGFGEGWLVPSLPAFMDMSETSDSIQVKVDLPGVKADEIDIQLNDNILTVSGEHKEEKEEKGRTFHRIERSSGRFSRTTALPCCVEDEKVAAEFHDGVLSITLPKAEAAKTHKIIVKS